MSTPDPLLVNRMVFGNGAFTDEVILMRVTLSLMTGVLIRTEMQTHGEGAE